MIHESVYFAQGLGGGPIKIGRSANPEQRLRAMQAGSPIELEILCAIPGDDVMEADLHELFAAGRLHGEWFDENTPGLSEGIEALIAPDMSKPRHAELHGLLDDLRSRMPRTARVLKAEPTASLREKATAGSDNEGA